MPTLFRNAALAFALAAMAGNAAAEGAFAQLYAARPPAGSSFVRIVNPAATPLRVQIADGPAQEAGAAKPATTYAIVKGNQAFTVQVDGKPAASLQVAPDTFSTLIPRRVDGKLTFAVVDDSNGAQDALKAELRFYNLAADCPAGQLGVSPSGPVLFQDVKPGAAAARAINPVSATLAAGCGAAASPTMSLPALQPGDHYSLFLTGTAAAPILRGQVSATDPYRR
ncbi:MULTISPECIES: alginate O-acetyltransferase AlgF [Achromobacter]|uniref:alginate O-acetyltransferase AlgF n=1 Tax=Achromobacter TaxID=222 RepID=UPI0028641A7A|nr:MULTISPECIES: alginate O-acetyltransferase AlgF [Achromobacter]MDR6602588.1 hypothetical protein [Achromobacter deleyi]